MVGDFENERDKGIIPRSFEFLFNQASKSSEYKFDISIAFIQIYLETLMDLIEPSNENIRIREDPDEGVYLEGCEWIKIKNLKECHEVFLIGERNRTTASTK